MRILIDTNVLISAILNVHSTPFKAYEKAISYPNQGLICEQNINEIKRIFKKKFPNHITTLNSFLSDALIDLELVPIPINENNLETLIRDIDDRPILRAAIKAEADIILTGDKDFLESGLENPVIMTPADFLNY